MSEKFDELVMPLLSLGDTNQLDSLRSAGIGWDQCKKAIIDLIENGGHYCSCDYDHINIINAIKEL
jgi:hypothetical protein